MGILRLSSAPLPAALVKASGDATVYVIAGGTKRPLTAWSDAVQLGGVNPGVLTVDAAWIASIPSGPQFIGDGNLVKGSSASVYMLSGGRLLGVTSFAVTQELGLGTTFRQVSDADLSVLGSTGPSLVLWVACGGVTYFAASGVLHAVQPPDPSFGVTALSDAACARMNVSGAAVSKVFLQAGGASVYVAKNGAYSPIGSWARLLQEAGGANPVILRISDATLRTLPSGDAAPLADGGHKPPQSLDRVRRDE